MPDETLLALGRGTIRNAESRSANICTRLSRTSWSGLRDKEAYPTEFIHELTKAGFLGAVIPEEYVAPACRTRRRR